jgi:hypothetical protein
MDYRPRGRCTPISAFDESDEVGGYLCGHSVPDKLAMEPRTYGGARLDAGHQTGCVALEVKQSS